MVLGNLGVMAAFSTGCYLLLGFARLAGRRAFPQLFEGLDTQGLVRLPSAPLVVFTFLYQGTAYGAAMLLMEPPNPVAFCAGLSSFVLCTAIPIGVFHLVYRAVPTEAVCLPDDVYTGRLWAFWIGPAEWVSVQRSNHWVNRYASVMRTYREGAVWFSIVEYGSMFAIAAASAARVGSARGCGHVKLFSAAVFAAQLAAEAVLRPHARGRNNLLDLVLLACQTCGLLCLSAGFYLPFDPRHWTHGAAENFFLAAWVTLAVKVVCDVLTELFIFAKGRRSRLQATAFGLLGPTDDANGLLRKARDRQMDNGRRRRSSGDGGAAFAAFADGNRKGRPADAGGRWEARGARKLGSLGVFDNEGCDWATGHELVATEGLFIPPSPRRGMLITLNPRHSGRRRRSTGDSTSLGFLNGGRDSAPPSSVDACDYREMQSLHGFGSFSAFENDAEDRVGPETIATEGFCTPQGLPGTRRGSLGLNQRHNGRRSTGGASLVFMAGGGDSARASPAPAKSDASFSLTRALC
ncbi:hypothetical protein DIPPA_06891 [Diplonema papillatum]|nr:hypothetical protein DIPPA_06891 [Diplonema papillatum]